MKNGTMSWSMPDVWGGSIGEELRNCTRFLFIHMYAWESAALNLISWWICLRGEANKYRLCDWCLFIFLKMVQEGPEPSSKKNILTITSEKKQHWKKISSWLTYTHTNIDLKREHWIDSEKNVLVDFCWKTALWGKELNCFLWTWNGNWIHEID